MTTNISAKNIVTLDNENGTFFKDSDDNFYVFNDESYEPTYTDIETGRVVSGTITIIIS